MQGRIGKETLVSQLWHNYFCCSLLRYCAIHFFLFCDDLYLKHMELFKKGSPVPKALAQHWHYDRFPQEYTVIIILKRLWFSVNTYKNLMLNKTFSFEVIMIYTMAGNNDCYHRYGVHWKSSCLTLLATSSQKSPVI